MIKTYLFLLLMVLLLLGAFACAGSQLNLQATPTPTAVHTTNPGYTPAGQQSAQVQALPSSIISGEYSIACTRVDRYQSGLRFYGTIWLTIRRIQVSSNPQPSTTVNLYDDHGNAYSAMTEWSRGAFLQTFGMSESAVVRRVVWVPTKSHWVSLGSFLLPLGSRFPRMPLWFGGPWVAQVLRFSHWALLSNCYHWVPKHSYHWATPKHTTNGLQ